jgi:hypothetical protein
MTRAQQQMQLITSYGIANAESCVRAAHEQDRPTLARCLALLENESGGRNVFGGEGIACPTEWREGPVTAERYAIYKHVRERLYSEGITADVDNGVGPTQLTSRGDQQIAEQLGGCWDAYHNMQAGFHILHGLILEHGVWGGYQQYNGGAELNREDEAYANIATERAAIWEARLEQHGLN